MAKHSDAYQFMRSNIINRQSASDSSDTSNLTETKPYKVILKAKLRARAAQYTCALWQMSKKMVHIVCTIFVSKENCTRVPSVTHWKQ